MCIKAKSASRSTVMRFFVYVFIRLNPVKERFTSQLPTGDTQPMHSSS